VCALYRGAETAQVCVACVLRVCVCVCVRERECVRVFERGAETGPTLLSKDVCVCVRERVCVSNTLQHILQHTPLPHWVRFTIRRCVCVCVWVCVFVCAWVFLSLSGFLSARAPMVWHRTVSIFI